MEQTENQIHIHDIVSFVPRGTNDTISQIQFVNTKSSCSTWNNFYGIIKTDPKNTIGMFHVEQTIAPTWIIINISHVKSKLIVYQKPIEKFIIS